MCIGVHVKYRLFFTDFNKTNFLYIFLKNTQISNFMTTLRKAPKNGLKRRAGEQPSLHDVKVTDIIKERQGL
jgi:hypothetical protein